MILLLTISIKCVRFINFFNFYTSIKNSCVNFLPNIIDGGGSVADAADGKCPGFLAIVLTMEGGSASTKVVVKGAVGSGFGGGPVEAVGVESGILAILGAATAQHGMEA